jgi:hypothetical protein
MYGNIRQFSILFQGTDNPSSEDYVENHHEPIGCGIMYSSYYFLSYVLIVKLIFLNLFIAIILQGFDDTNQQEDQLINGELTHIFKEKWANLDPEGTSFIQVFELEDLLYSLGNPLGWDLTFRGDENKRQKFKHDLKLPLYQENKYCFLDVLEALALRLMVQE